MVHRLGKKRRRETNVKQWDNSSYLFRVHVQIIFVSVSHTCACTHINRKQFSSVQSHSRVRLFATPWLAAREASLSFTNSRGLLKLMSITSVMPSNHLILCCPLFFLPSIFPSIRVFSNESVLCIRWPNIGVSASASLLPMNIQDWSPLGWTGWIS